MLKVVSYTPFPKRTPERAELKVVVSNERPQMSLSDIVVSWWLFPLILLTKTYSFSFTYVEKERAAR
jgi:hypothetical protein